MNNVKKVLLAVLMAAIVMLGQMGCAHPQKEHPTGEDASKEHPSKEDASKEHPSEEKPAGEHPAGEHPK